MVGSSEILVCICNGINTWMDGFKSDSSFLPEVETFCCIKSVLELLLTEVVSIAVKYS